MDHHHIHSMIYFTISTITITIAVAIVVAIAIVVVLFTADVCIFCIFSMLSCRFVIFGMWC